jgi:hypothetical protein
MKIWPPIPHTILDVGQTALSKELCNDEKRLASHEVECTYGRAMTIA